MARLNEQGGLVATGFLADQKPLLGTLPEHLDEAFSDIAKVKIYQARIGVIQDVTKLDFGPLAAADSFPGGEALEEGGRRLIESLDDIIL